MFWFRPLRICGSENSPCAIFQCAHFTSKEPVCGIIVTSDLFLCRPPADVKKKKKKPYTLVRSIATRVDTTDVAANRAGVGKNKTQCTFSRTTFTVLAETVHSVLRVLEAQVGPSEWSITRLHIALYIPNMEKSFAFWIYFSSYKKKNKKRDREREKIKTRMHCVARVSIKFKAIFRAHRFFFLFFYFFIFTHCDWSSLVDSK